MSRVTSYSYDLQGNVVARTLPNGERVEQSFDALNRVGTIEGQKPSAGGLLYRYAHRYDLAGNVVFIREAYQTEPAKWREINQGYDGAHRLTSEKYRHSAGGILGAPDSDRDVLYTYDAADNRTAKEIHYLSPERETYSYNALNQLTQLEYNRPARVAQTAGSRTVEYQYDLNGNRVRRAEGTAERTYAYDYEQRLAAVTNSTLEPAYAYTYDYRTRRIAIVATPEAGAATTTALSFSGGTSVQEYVNSTLEVEFVRGSDWGGGVGGILYSLRGGQASFTHYNNRGDVVAKTDTTSTLTYQAAYEAYGTRSEEAGSTLDRQKANTKDEDPTGLLNEGFRYRDLETGMFITRDPAGFVDGPNLYTYVRQNPWSRFDPSGLESRKKRAEYWATKAQERSSNVKSIGDFMDLMTNEFPKAVASGLASIPEQLSGRGRELSKEAAKAVIQDPSPLTAMLVAPQFAFGKGAGVAGAIGETALDLPGKASTAAKQAAASTGFFGDEARDKAIEDTTTGARMVGAYGLAVRDNPIDVPRSAVTGEELSMTASVSYSTPGVTASATVDGAPLPSPVSPSALSEKMTASKLLQSAATATGDVSRVTAAGAAMVNLAGNIVDIGKETNGVLRQAGVQPEAVQFKLKLRIDDK